MAGATCVRRARLVNIRENVRREFVVGPELQIGEINLRLDIVRHGGLMRIVHHAHDREHRVRSFVSDFQLLSQRILAWKVLLHESLVDHGDQLHSRSHHLHSANGHAASGCPRWGKCWDLPPAPLPVACSQGLSAARRSQTTPGWPEKFGDRGKMLVRAAESTPGRWDKRSSRGA